MKKIFLFMFLFFAIFHTTFWNYDFENDYTLIDCIDWNDSTWVAFDKEQPYQSLKSWIENTIKYINSNINISNNEALSDWKEFKIKVQCSGINIFNSSININFEWLKFNNKLIIEGIDENSLVFDNIKIIFSEKSWWIYIKNAQFKNYTKYIFEHYVYYSWYNRSYYYKWRTIEKPISYWINIENSIFSFNEEVIFWAVKKYTQAFKWTYSNSYRSYDSYFNWLVIDNSIINITWITQNYNFTNTAKISNSKINFITNWEEKYNFNFWLRWWSLKDSSLFLWNQIDLWWNNLTFQNNNKIWFINNIFKNFDEIIFPWETVFLNNTFENEKEVDISESNYFFNNTFKNDFLNVSDLNNIKRNYLIEDSWTKWIWWYYLKNSNIDYFNVNLSSHELVEELTWIKTPNLKDSVYIIFK